jgi:hypothetical protein
MQFNHNASQLKQPHSNAHPTTFDIEGLRRCVTSFDEMSVGRASDDVV